MTSPRMKIDTEFGQGLDVSKRRAAASAAGESSQTSLSRSVRRLSNNAINFIVDAILLGVFMAVLALTAIVQFILPDAATSINWTLWSLNRTTWLRIQAGSIAVFGMLVLLHLILHWSWVCSFVSSRLSKFLGRTITVNESAKTIWGVATLIFILTCIGMVLMAAEFCVVTGK